MDEGRRTTEGRDEGSGHGMREGRHKTERYDIAFGRKVVRGNKRYAQAAEIESCDRYETG